MNAFVSGGPDGNFCVHTDSPEPHQYQKFNRVDLNPTCGRAPYGTTSRWSRILRTWTGPRSVLVCMLMTPSCVQLIKVYSEDSHSKSVWVSSGATAREVCHILVQTAHCSDQENWALLEVHPTLGLGKNTRFTCIHSPETTRCTSQPGIRVVLQRGAWRTTRSCWRFRHPGPLRVTRGSSSAKTMPSMSSSGSRR